MGRELHVDRFRCGLVGELEVGLVTFGGVRGASAMGFAALHHPPQHGPFAEVPQLLEIPPEFTEALRVAFHTLFQPPDSAPGCMGMWHCSSGNNTVRIWQPQAPPSPTLHQRPSSSLCSSPGWPPPVRSNCPSTRSNPNNKPKAATCNACSSRPTCSIAAAAMGEPRCASHSNLARRPTPIRVCAHALS